MTMEPASWFVSWRSDILTVFYCMRKLTKKYLLRSKLNFILLKVLLRSFKVHTNSLYGKGTWSNKSHVRSCTGVKYILEQWSKMEDIIKWIKQHDYVSNIKLQNRFCYYCWCSSVKLLFESPFWLGLTCSCFFYGATWFCKNQNI